MSNSCVIPNNVPDLPKIKRHLIKIPLKLLFVSINYFINSQPYVFRRDPMKRFEIECEMGKIRSDIDDMERHGMACVCVCDQKLSEILLSDIILMEVSWIN